MRVGDLWQTLSRLALLGLIGGLAGACSADTQRFAGNPFSNPFSTGPRGEPAMTGSLPAAAPAPTMAVESQPLAPPAQRSATAPIYNAPPGAAPAVAPVGQAPRPAAVPPAPAGPAPASVAGWTTAGGTRVTVASGESLAGIATRYGVPAAAILSANGLTAAQVAAGRQLIIPVYHAGVAGAANAAAPARSAAAPAPARQAAVAPAQPTYRLVPGPKAAEPKEARKPEPRRPEARKPEPQARKPEAKKPEPKKPEPKRAEAKKAEPEPKKPAITKQPVAAKPEPKRTEVAKSELPKQPAKPERVAALQPVATAPKTAAVPAPAPEPAKPVPDVKQTASIADPQSQGTGLNFRWPARGRVIAGFGGQGGNEGINIAVPEGTPVKAAEDGTVAYAGNGLKGYGNLVLIRHENGFVSAYAHNGELGVRPGEKVKRGQVIARSGQTGNVTSPQLHFEIRKGATPVDPMPHLGGG